MSRLLVPPLPPTPPQEETPFYGWRYLRRLGADGREYLEEIPLTLEDVLYPQEGDRIPMRPQHQIECAYLANVFRNRFAHDPSIAVLSDCLIDWGMAGQRNHEPDLTVFHEVRIPPNPRQGTFRLRPSGGRIVLVVEVVSPDTRENDVVRKPVDYHRLGIPFYGMIDQQQEEGPRVLHGYRWTPGGYEEVPLDAAGHLSLPVGIELALEDGWLACYDAATGRRLGDYQEIDAARQAAEERQRQAEEGQRQAEEGQRQAEEGQRQAEERQRHAEERQRQAEERQRQEAAARQAAEERLQDLEAELSRLRGQS